MNSVDSQFSRVTQKAVYKRGHLKRDNALLWLHSDQMWRHFTHVLLQIISKGGTWVNSYEMAVDGQYCVHLGVLGLK